MQREPDILPFSEMPEWVGLKTGKPACCERFICAFLGLWYAMWCDDYVHVLNGLRTAASETPPHVHCTTLMKRSAKISLRNAMIEKSQPCWMAFRVLPPRSRVCTSPPKTAKQAVTIKNGERYHSMTRYTMKKQKIPARYRRIPTLWPWRTVIAMP